MVLYLCLNLVYYYIFLLEEQTMYMEYIGILKTLHIFLESITIATDYMYSLV